MAYGIHSEDREDRRQKQKDEGGAEGVPCCCVHEKLVHEIDFF